MGNELRIFFIEDVANRLAALAQANERALTVAVRYGMNPEAAALCRDIYAGALADVAAAFGLSWVTVTAISRSDLAMSLPQATRVERVA